ncbi:MAG: pentapeptide repeat-containing protein [Rhizomicrobium sp.]
MLGKLYEERRVALTQKELNAVLLSHERYLTRLGGGVRACLKHARLDGLNLACRNLAEADFSDASLVGANVSGSNLERASLYCADLRNCNLQSARLPRADLRGASFGGARLAFAVLDGADLRAATMMYVGPGGISVISRDKSKGGPSVDFSNCSLKSASFGNAKLDGANFSGALLQGATFKGARLTNVVFKGAVLTGVNLKELAVPAAALEGCVTDAAPLSPEALDALRGKLDAHQRWIETGGAEGAPATVDGADLRPLRDLLVGRPLAGLSARNTVAIGLDFSTGQFQAAKFDGADLRDVDFSGADLRGICLRDTRLAHARFDKANLGHLRLANGTLLAPDLTGADAQADQFFGAILDNTAAALGLAVPQREQETVLL